jgi:[ribosomal protein S18]-alanine N-acetyltransferase
VPSAKSQRPRVKSAFLLRDYALQDFDALLALDRACFAQGIAYSERELSGFLHRRGSFTVVAEDARRQVCGFLIAHVQRTYGWIITIDIAESARRHRLGTLLMEEAEQRLRASGVTAIVLEVAVDNVAAITFYKRLGYSVMRTLPRYYLDSLDAFQMAKQL